jgi:hypothetical protein
MTISEVWCITFPLLIAVPVTPGGTGMDVSFVQVLPPSAEYSRSALLLLFQVKLNLVMTIWSGFAGLTAIPGSLPPVLFAAGHRIAMTNTPGAL